MIRSTLSEANRRWISRILPLLTVIVLACCALDEQEPEMLGEITSAISAVQNNNGGTGSTSATFNAVETAGDLNVVVVGWADATTTVTSVTDTRGNSYLLAAPMVTIAGAPALRQAIYYAKNIAGGANTVHVAFSAAPNFPDLRVLEYSGIDPSAPFDVTASASGSGVGGATVSSGNAAATSANELLVGAGMTTWTYGAAGASFTQRVITSDGNIAEDRIVSATGSYNATAVLSGPSQTWIMQMIAFKGAIAPPPPAPTLTSIAPNSGPPAGGTTTTLSGTHFVSGATVSFCGTAATGVTFVSASQMTARTPAHASGACDVKVQNPDAQSSTLPSGFTYSAGTAPLAWVQTKNGGTGATNATFNASETAGNLNVVVVGWADNTTTVTAVTDTRGNTYALAAPMITVAGAPSLRQAIYYAKNIAGGTNTVNVAFSAAPNFPDLRVLEYSGADRSSPFDVTVSASGSASGGATVSSGNATTTSPNELLVGAGMTTWSYGGSGSSFTQRVITSDGNIAEDRIVSATGAYGATAVLTGPSQTWIMQMIAFKASPAGVCTPTTCAAQGKNCGTISDACGSTLTCGTCTSPATCGGGGTANVCGSPAGGYTTSFSLTENPISEHGNWINNSTNRTRVTTAGGIAFGTQVGGAFDDSYARLTGTWPADQQITATVFKGSTSGIQEVELLFRASDSPGSGNVTLYEINFAHNGQYVDFVRWTGGIATSSFVYVIPTLTFSMPGGAVNNGDRLRGQIVGNTLTAWIDRNDGLGWTFIGMASDTTGPGGGAVLTSGTPGMGFFKTSGSGAMNNYGFTDYSAVGL